MTPATPVAPRRQPSTATHLVQAALRHHEQGDVEQAEALYGEALQADPSNADAWHLRGVLAQQTGRLDVAVRDITHAIALNGSVAYFHNNLGVALQERGDLDGAIAGYREAIRLKPDYAEAYNNLGAALQRQGDLDAALACCQEALRLNPSCAGVYNTLGNAFADREEWADAIESYAMAVQLDPGNASAYANLGRALRERGDAAMAKVACLEAIRLRPSLAEAHNNLGNVLRTLGSLKEALVEYREALRYRPAYVEAYFNQGVVLQDQRHKDAAIASYREALRIKPDYIDTLVSLGGILLEDRLPEALVYLREALRLDPECVAAHDHLTAKVQWLCEWDELDKLWAQTRRIINERPSEVLFPFNVMIRPTTPAEQLACARTYTDKVFASTERWREELGFQHVPRPKSRLRVGYLSADFRRHPVAHHATPVLSHHDRDAVEVFGYAINPDDDSESRRRFVAACDHFVDLDRASADEAAKRIYADGIDILVDLTGYTEGNRTHILALRPAPIQVSYLGYPGTMGAGFIDYLVADRFVIPPEQERFYSERVVCMPGSLMSPGREWEIAEETPTRAAWGLPEDGFVYCSFNRPNKISPDVFDVWMRLLQKTPGSVLWLSEANPWVADNLRREARARGVVPDRLVFARIQGLPTADYRALFRLADLFLDTPLYNAGTTACDVLWVGLPLVTCARDTFVSRLAGSLLTALETPELITTSLEEYEALALRLAHEPEELAALRAKLALKRDTAPLFDAAGFTRALEGAYREMWDAAVADVASAA